ncbi:ankyrin repeat domain-containing protein 29-like [Physella acuta]|uniref:ankyrin repeat domain-containing protein 29-like n=1 Tax=Physella acuta TaxID=109671 RepID=UPI0027DE33B8|nr:ankyrin repeat domain-containing protein 29-like [Physella acuta]
MSNNQIVQRVLDLALKGETEKLQNCNINCRNRYGISALMIAVMKNNLLALKTLISAGADVNLTRNNSRFITALTIAVERQQVECVKELIKAGASLACQKAIDALKMAKNYNFLHLVVERYRGFTDHSDHSPLTPFYLANQHKCFDLLVDLINGGSAVDIESLQFEDFIRPDIFNALIRSGKVDVNKQY